MEKSIEMIWKEGFLNNNALVAPKLNDLYNQKSQDIVEKFQRMFRINLVALVVFSFVVLIASFVVDMQYMGVPMFILLNVLVLVNQKYKKSMTDLDKGASSYNYLMSFNNWMNKQVAANARMARIYYPVIFLSMVAGFWGMKLDGEHFGQTAINGMIQEFPNLILVAGIPLVVLIVLATLTGIVSLLGGWLYRIDLKIVYGRVMQNIKEVLADMEELRA